MPDSEITVDGLVAQGGAGQVSLTWNSPVDEHTSRGGLPYLQLSAIEIWASPINNRDEPSTVRIGEQPQANSFVHAGLNRGETFYYWIRPRDRSGQYGEWHPTLATDGVVGTESNSDVLFAQDGYWRNPAGLILQWGIASAEADVSTTIDFPLVFPNQCFSVHLTPTSMAQHCIYRHASDDSFPGRTGFRFDLSAASTINWFAIGY